MKYILILFAALAVYGQPETRLSQKNADQGYQFKIWNDGTNPTTVCKALSLQPTSNPISIASATNAATVVFTVSGGHGLNTDARPLITISGGAGQWVVANATWTATPINSTTFSVPLDSTLIGALTGTVVFTTRAPLLTMPVWSVAKYTWSGSIPTGSFWYNGNSSTLTTCSAEPTTYQ